MAGQKGKAQPKYSEQQKAEIVEKVCELYESQHVTVESCCNAVGVSDRLFRFWVSENPELSERYKKAKQNQDVFYWEDIIKPKAKTALQRLLEGEETEDVEIRELSDKGVLTGDQAKTIKRSRSMPNPTAVIFALKGEYPDRFADRQKVETDLNLVWHEEKTYAADSQTDEGAGLSGRPADD